MWKILICDDDDTFLQNFKKSIINVAGNKVKEIKMFNEKDQLEFYVADHPRENNIIIIDIRLGEDNGIQLARKVLQYQPNSQIIFISGYDGYFLDVYDVDHVYFLRKPIEPEHLERALIRAGEKLRDLEVSMLAITNKQGVHKISFSEILYFESERRRIHLYTAEDKISFYGKLDDLMEKLDKRFMKCHNSYIVNITQVKELRDKKFYFNKSKGIPVSKTYYTDVREAFLEYVGEQIIYGGGVPRLVE